MFFKKSGYRKQGKTGVNRIASLFSQSSTFIVPWRVTCVFVGFALKECPLPEAFFVSEWPHASQVRSFIPDLPQLASLT